MLRKKPSYQPDVNGWLDTDQNTCTADDDMHGKTTGPGVFVQVACPDAGMVMRWGEGCLVRGKYGLIG